MKRSNAIAIALSVAFLSFTDIAVSATDPRAAEVEAVIKQYFHYMDIKNWGGTESLTTPELVVVDYGQRFNRAGWDEQMSGEVEVIGADKNAGIDPILTSDFDTRVVCNEVAYANFKQHFKSNPQFYEASIMVLRRIGGKWLIDSWSIHEGGDWSKWLRDRIRAKGGKVEANWYELYKKERDAEVPPKYY